MTKTVTVTYCCDGCGKEGPSGMFGLNGPIGWYVVERGGYSTDRAQLCSAACLVDWSKKRAGEEG